MFTAAQAGVAKVGRANAQTLDESEIEFERPQCAWDLSRFPNLFHFKGRSIK
jgi:hypothetical protein